MAKTANCIRSAWLGRRCITTTTEGRSGHTAKNLRFVTKTLLVMKLTVLFLTVGIFNVCASGVSQTVSFSGQNVPLKSVLSSVEKQTGFVFMYTKPVINSSKPVSVSVQNLPLEQFLSQIFSAQPLQFDIRGKNIFLSAKSSSPQPSSGTFDVLKDTLIDVRGKVVDEKGEPLAGANIMVKGTKRGVVSGADGSFSIEAKEGEVLVLSSIGYSPREIRINDSAEVGAVVLAISESKLDEVQIKAYGTTSQRLSTSNITSVKAKDIEKQPVTNPLLALQGRVPGITIEQSTGFANSGVTVRIQGQNSLKKGSDPLYVIDGMPITSRLPSSLAYILGSSGANGQDVAGAGSGVGNPMSFLNPMDIESIEVLKDADATSIYGSRAAAGAILITTKKGKAGQVKVDVNVQHGIGQVGRKMKMLNTQQYLQMRKEAFANYSLPVPDASTAPDDANVDLTVWDQNKYTDWQKVLIGGTAQYTNANASVSGGSQNIQYLVGGGINRQTTVFPGDLSNRKAALHSSITTTSSNQKFRMQLTSNYMFDINNLVNTDLTPLAMQLAPNAPALYSEDGTVNYEPLPNGSSTWENPIAYLNQKIKIRTTNLINNLTLSYQISPRLSIRNTIGYTDMRINEKKLSPLSVYMPEYRGFFTRETNVANNGINSWLMEPQLNFKQALWKGNVDILVGSTIQQTNTTRLAVNASGFTSDILMENLAAAPMKSMTSGAADYKYDAVFGSLNYNIGNTYILNVTGRRDGSSRFGSANRFNNFGSIAGAWIFSNEGFIKKALSLLSFGKLKLGYGTTGNDQIGDYQYLNTYGNLIAQVQVPYQNATGLTPSRLPNAYLQWEETRKLSLGLELGFLADRVFVSGSYYRNRSGNQLLSYNLPIVTGFENVTQNFNALTQNSGFELSLTTRNIKSKTFEWTTDLNLTIARNKLLSFPELETSSYATEYVVGKPFTITKKYGYIGVDPATGLYLVKDKEGKPTTTPVPGFQPNTDAVVLVDLTPKYYGGFRNSVSLGAWNLDFLFQFVKQLANSPLEIGTAPGVFYGSANVGNQPVWILNRWQKAGDIAKIQKYATDLSYDFQTRNNAGGSEATVTDASYIRLKNLSLSWSLPAYWQKSLTIRAAKLFLQGQNLWTITRFRHLDPETRSSLVLPPLRVITFGAQITF